MRCVHQTFQSNNELSQEIHSQIIKINQSVFIINRRYLYRRQTLYSLT